MQLSRRITQDFLAVVFWHVGIFLTWSVYFEIVGGSRACCMLGRWSLCLAGSVSLCSLQLALTKRKHRLRTVISDVSLRLHRTLGRTAEGAGTSPLFCPGIGLFYRARKRLVKAGDARTASEVSAEGWGLSLLVISSLIMMVIVLVVMQ